MIALTWRQTLLWELGLLLSILFLAITIYREGRAVHWDWSRDNCYTGLAVSHVAFGIIALLGLMVYTPFR